MASNSHTFARPGDDAALLAATVRALEALAAAEASGVLQSGRRFRLEIRLGEELLGVERGHAAGAGRGDRLAVDLVHHVAAGEDAGHAGPGACPASTADIAVGVEVEMALEQLGRRAVADRDERALGVEPLDRAGLRCP